MGSGGRAQLPPPPPPPPPRPPPPSPAPTENHNHTAISLPLLQPAAGAEARLTRWLRRLEAFLSAVGLAVSSRMGVAAAGSALAVVGIALPAMAVALSPCRGRARQCDEFEVETFEVCVLLSEAAAAAVSLGCVSRKMAMYGIRKFLFVDPELGMRIRFQKEYVAKIKVTSRADSERYCFQFVVDLGGGQLIRIYRELAVVPYPAYLSA